jgi:hypothetical protein
MTEDSIFTNSGTIRRDFDKMEVSPERRPALDALAAAQLMCEQTEAEFKSAETAVTAAVRRRNDIAAKIPRRSFRDEWLASTTHPDNRRR